MQTFILLTRITPEALKSPSSMEDFEKRAVSNIDQECPEVKWLHSYALMGPYDYLDSPNVFHGTNSMTCANSVLPTFMRHSRSFKPERIANVEFPIQIVDTHDSLETCAITGFPAGWP